MKYLLSLLALFALPATAQEIGNCDWRANAQNIAEPWSENTRVFANGDVRVTLIDTVEPISGAYHLMVLAPPFDELGLRNCRLVSYRGGEGFSGVGFETLAAQYDPEIGLILSMPVQVFEEESSEFVRGDLLMTINQSRGETNAFMELDFQ